LEVLLTEIDDLLRHEHFHLTRDDKCYALREYIARGGWQAGETNQLIMNLKKTLDRRGKAEWRHKVLAIHQAGTELRGAMNAKWLDGAVLVPMPPSKATGDNGYDDRMLQVVCVMREGTGAQVREILRQRASTTPHHLQERSRDVDALVENFTVDETCCEPPPPRIAVVDDVLTTGAHFCAARRVLSRRFPTTPVIGLFVARRAIVKDVPDV
jgi:predicted amidophosphoribosyltransferase